MEEVSLCPALRDTSFCADPVACSEAERRVCDSPIWSDIKILSLLLSRGPACTHPAEVSLRRLRLLKCAVTDGVRQTEFTPFHFSETEGGTN